MKKYFKNHPTISDEHFEIKESDLRHEIFHKSRFLGGTAARVKSMAFRLKLNEDVLLVTRKDKSVKEDYLSRLSKEGVECVVTEQWNTANLQNTYAEVDGEACITGWTQPEPIFSGYLFTLKTKQSC